MQLATLYLNPFNLVSIILVVILQVAIVKADKKEYGVAEYDALGIYLIFIMPLLMFFPLNLAWATFAYFTCADKKLKF